MFATVVGMLAPPGKYKKFVSLIMGFVLLAVMIQPLARFASAMPLTDWFHGLAPDMGTTEGWDSSYEEWRNTYLSRAFHSQLIAQLTHVLQQNNFTVHNADVTFQSDFSAITGVQVTVSERPAEPQRVPFIRIQPVQVGPQPEEPPCPTSEAVKKIISQFYNLPEQHIFVTVVP